MINHIKHTAPIGALALLLSLPTLAGPEAGDRTLTLSGSGGSDKKFDSNTFGGNAAIGWFATDEIQWGFRQSLTVGAQRGDDPNSASGKTTTTWNAATRGFADYHFGSGAFRPFVGANLGAIYGDHINNTGAAGLEVGFKAYVQEKTYITFQAEYDYLFNTNDDIQSNFDDGAIFYTLGVGFNF